jgi:membrane protein YqaA with SNARE-associated domain
LKKPHKLPYFLQYLIACIIFFTILFLVYTFIARNPNIFSRGGMEQILHSYGFLGIFIMAIIANATLFLPLPIDAAVYLLAYFDFGFGVFNPALLGIFAGIGSAIGEISGYIVGLLGRQGIKKLAKSEVRKIHRIQEGMYKYGFAFIALTAMTPFPFDLVGIAAGLMKFEPKKFFLACLLGKIARCVLIAYAGFFSLNFLAALFGVNI